MDRRWDRLSRRAFVLGAAGLGLLAGCGRLPWQGPPSARIPSLGVLSPSSPEFSRDFEDGPFRRALQDLGYVDGHNLTLEVRHMEGRNERLPELMAMLVNLPVDVLVVGGPEAVEAAKRATSTVSIVMVGGSGDPVAAGYVASLARPGGNITGLTTAPAELTDQKRLELLRGALPGRSRVGVLRHTTAFSSPSGRPRLELAAQGLGLELQYLDVPGPEELDAAFEAAAEGAAEAVLVTAAPMLVANTRRVSQLALASGLPTISTFREFATGGGLMAYGVSLPELWKRAAYYVDRILKGTKPADLPVEQPMTFEFVVNMKTAHELGISFPNEIMLQVTEVIQ